MGEEPKDAKLYFPLDIGHFYNLYSYALRKQVTNLLMLLLMSFACSFIQQTFINS